MINLSLTDFVDISAKNGMSKYRNVVKVKRRPAYTPAFDYYKRLREHIIEIHKGDFDKSSFLPVTELTKDEKKYINYQNIIAGYKKFWGNRIIRWIEPPHDVWTEGAVNVNINPEIGLWINDKPYVIKMYFKNDKLSKARAEISLFLMHQMLPPQHESTNVNYSIIDIRNSRLITIDGFNEGILAALRGEAGYIESVWDSIS